MHDADIGAQKQLVVRLNHAIDGSHTFWHFYWGNALCLLIEADKLSLG